MSNEDSVEPTLRNDSLDDDGDEDSPRRNKGKIVLSLGDNGDGDAWTLLPPSSESSFDAIKSRTPVDGVGGNSVDTGASAWLLAQGVQ